MRRIDPTRYGQLRGPRNTEPWQPLGDDEYEALLASARARGRPRTVRAGHSQPTEGTHVTDLDALYLAMAQEDELAALVVPDDVGPRGKMVFGRNPATGCRELYESEVPDMSAADTGRPSWIRDDDPQWSTARSVLTTEDGYEPVASKLRAQGLTRGARQAQRTVEIADSSAATPGGTQRFIEVCSSERDTSLHRPNGAPAELVEVGGARYVNLGSYENPRWERYEGPATSRPERRARTASPVPYHLRGLEHAYDPSTGQPYDPATGQLAGAQHLPSHKGRRPQAGTDRVFD